MSLSAGDSRGDDGASDERMLCNVLALSLPLYQLGAKTDEPKGLPPRRLARCGIEPALNLESIALV